MDVTSPPLIPLSTAQLYKPLIYAVVMYKVKVLDRVSLFVSYDAVVVTMLTLLFPDTSVFPSGSVQVMFGLGRPDATQANVATEGDVTV